MTDVYDAIVIGGGIVGASSAYHLSRAGVKTLLLDREDDGRATDAGAGILSPATSSRTASDDWFAFATDAVGYYDDLLECLARDGVESTGYDRTGLLAVAVSETEVDRYEATLERIEARTSRLGAPKPGSVEEVEPATARDRFPPLGDVERAFYYEDAARVDGRAFAGALCEAGRAHGLTVELGDVESIEREHEAVTGIRTVSGRFIETGRVIVAGGAWSRSFADDLGIALPIEPQRGQLVHLEWPGSRTDDWPLISGFGDHYVVPWPGGRVVVGATRESGSGFDVRATAGGVQEVLEEALSVAPGLEAATFRAVRVGVRPTTPDGLPILGAVPGADGAYLATGHGPTGLQLGPYSATLVAELAMGESVGDALEPFTVERFGRRR